MRSNFKKIISEIIFNEDGNEAVQMACLMPIILLVVAFMQDRFLIGEGAIYTSTAANEAIRAAAVQKTDKDARKVALETLTDRLQSTGMGWCSGGSVNGCYQWGNGATIADNESSFNRKEETRAALYTTKGWCNGSYVILKVRAHKASLLPSYSTFRRLLKNGGPIYHEHVYTVKARVESTTICSK